MRVGWIFYILYLQNKTPTGQKGRYRICTTTDGSSRRALERPVKYFVGLVSRGSSWDHRRREEFLAIFYFGKDKK